MPPRLNPPDSGPNPPENPPPRGVKIPRIAVRMRPKCRPRRWASFPLIPAEVQFQGPGRHHLPRIETNSTRN